MTYAMLSPRSIASRWRAVFYFVGQNWTLGFWKNKTSELFGNKTSKLENHFTWAAQRSTIRIYWFWNWYIYRQYEPFLSFCKIPRAVNGNVAQFVKSVLHETSFHASRRARAFSDAVLAPLYASVPSAMPTGKGFSAATPSPRIKSTIISTPFSGSPGCFPL